MVVVVPCANVGIINLNFNFDKQQKGKLALYQVSQRKLRATVSLFLSKRF